MRLKGARGTQEGTGAQGPFTIAPLHNAQMIYEGNVKHMLFFIYEYYYATVVAHLLGRQVKLCV